MPDMFGELLKITGLFFWCVILLWGGVRVIFGKNWASKMGLYALTGTRLKSTIDKTISEAKNNEIQDETIAELLANILIRFTRVISFSLILTILPILLIFYQNILIGNQNDLFGNQNKSFEIQNDLIKLQDSRLRKQNELLEIQNENLKIQTQLFEKQTDLLSTQNNLTNEQVANAKDQIQSTEAQRKSSLILLMSNIMDQIADELKNDYNNDTIRNLSPELISRISGLSYGLKPYKYIKDGEMIEISLSPEKGQLLVNLLNSQLDPKTYDSIYAITKFTNCDLGNVFLKGAYLKGIDLSGSYLANSNINNSDFEGAILRNTDFTKASLSYSNFSPPHNATYKQVNFMNASFKEAKFEKSNLSRCLLFQGDFQGAYFFSTNLTLANFYLGKIKGSSFQSANLKDANLIGANIQDAYFTDKTILEGAQVDNINWLVDLEKNGARVAGKKKLLEKYKIDSSSFYKIGSPPHFRISKVND